MPEGKVHCPSASGGRIIALEILITKVLKIGVVICSVVIALGLILLLFSSDQSTHPDASLPDIWQALLTGKGFAIIDLGLLVLVQIPVFCVAASMVLFLKEKDYLYAGITFFVFITLILSFMLGKGA